MSEPNHVDYPRPKVLYPVPRPGRVSPWRVLAFTVVCRGMVVACHGLEAGFQLLDWIKDRVVVPEEG